MPRITALYVTQGSRCDSLTQPHRSVIPGVNEESPSPVSIFLFNSNLIIILSQYLYKIKLIRTKIAFFSFGTMQQSAMAVRYL